LIVDDGLCIGRFAREWVASGFDFVDVSVVLLFFGRDAFVVVLELLGWGEAGKEGEVGCHLYNLYQLKFIKRTAKHTHIRLNRI